jgi:hypothetical protein
MSFINSYDEIKAQIEERIDNIDGLSATDAALVAAAAQLLNGRNQSIANMQALLTYLQNRQDGVDDDTTIKDIVLLLGASMGSKNVVWRMREFLADGTFTVPNNIAGGVVYVTGCGGGGGGTVGFSNSQVSGGFGGAYCQSYPVSVVAGEMIPVTIGAGGLAITGVGSTGNPGGNTSFGSKITLSGGSGGREASLSNEIAIFSGVGIKPQLIKSASIYSQSESVNGNVAGITASDSSSSTPPAAISTGGAAGLFGNGGNGSVTGNAGSAPANSGAGGASSLGGFAAGNGGSGRIIVEWQEFV